MMLEQQQQYAELKGVLGGKSHDRGGARSEDYPKARTVAISAGLFAEDEGKKDDEPKEGRLLLSLLVL